MKKRPRGRPKVRPDSQHVHLQLARDLYDRLQEWKAESGVPVNTLIERAVKAALERRETV
jgi:hypothetical protein